MFDDRAYVASVLAILVVLGSLGGRWVVLGGLGVAQSYVQL